MKKFTYAESQVLLPALVLWERKTTILFNDLSKEGKPYPGFEPALKIARKLIEHFSNEVNVGCSALESSAEADSMPSLKL